MVGPKFSNLVGRLGSRLAGQSGRFLDQSELEGETEIEAGLVLDFWHSF